MDQRDSTDTASPTAVASEQAPQQSGVHPRMNGSHDAATLDAQQASGDATTTVESAEPSGSTAPQSHGEAFSEVGKKRKPAYVPSDEELRGILDPEGKMTKKQWRKARAEYHLNSLPPELRQAGLERKAKADAKREQNLKVLEEQERASDVVNMDVVNSTEYYFENGRRCVWPYYYVHRSNAKGRWVGQTLREMLKFEFAQEDEFIQHQLKHQRFLVNGKPAGLDYVFEMGDVFEHSVHRHEAPVRPDPVRIAVRDDAREIIVVDKPCTVPVHPGGKFMMNSALYILAKEHKETKLYMVHRIDRPTSGLLILARSPKAAARMASLIVAHNVRKHYLARIHGRFPGTLEEAKALSPTGTDPCLCTTPAYLARARMNNGVVPDAGSALATGIKLPSMVEGGVSAELWPGVQVRAPCVQVTDGGNPWEGKVEIVVDRPLAALNAKFGYFAIGAEPVSSEEGQGTSDEKTANKASLVSDRLSDPDAKVALSLFRLVAYDPDTDTSLVHCLPFTGRTHQLRIHLAHLGFPIANDERYGGRIRVSWREYRRSLGLDEYDDSKRLASEYETESSATTQTQSDIHAAQDTKQDVESEEEKRLRLWKQSYEPTCLFCQDITSGIWTDRFHFIRGNQEEVTDDMDAVLPQRDSTLPAVSSLEDSREQPTEHGAEVESSQHAIEDVDSHETSKPFEIPRLENGHIDMTKYPKTINIDPEREAIWLHAYKYEGPGFAYQVFLPDFAGIASFDIPSFQK